MLPHGDDPQAVRASRKRRKIKRTSLIIPPPSPLPLTEFPASELPAEFPRELSYRALAAYSLIRTLSIQLRLSPFTPIVFLRALYFPFPNRILGQVHVAILRILLDNLQLGYHWGTKQSSAFITSKKRKVDGIRWPLRAGDNLGLLDLYTWPVFFDDYCHLTADTIYASLHDQPDKCLDPKRLVSRITAEERSKSRKPTRGPSDVGRDSDSNEEDDDDEGEGNESDDYDEDEFQVDEDEDAEDDDDDDVPRLKKRRHNNYGEQFSPEGQKRKTGKAIVQTQSNNLQWNNSYVQNGAYFSSSTVISASAHDNRTQGDDCTNEQNDKKLPREPGPVRTSDYREQYAFEKESSPLHQQQALPNIGSEAERKSDETVLALTSVDNAPTLKFERITSEAAPDVPIEPTNVKLRSDLVSEVDRGNAVVLEYVNSCLDSATATPIDALSSTRQYANGSTGTADNKATSMSTTTPKVDVGAPPSCSPMSYPQENEYAVGSPLHEVYEADDIGIDELETELHRSGCTFMRSDDCSEQGFWNHFDSLKKMRLGLPYHRLPVQDKISMLEFLIDELLSIDTVRFEFEKRHATLSQIESLYGCSPTREQLETLVNEDECAVCTEEGELLCCDGCIASYHRTCIDMSIAQPLPEGRWLCPECQVVDPAAFGPLGYGRKSSLDWFSSRDLMCVSNSRSFGVGDLQLLVIHGFAFARKSVNKELVADPLTCLQSPPPMTIPSGLLKSATDFFTPEIQQDWPLNQIPRDDQASNYFSRTESFDPSMYFSKYDKAPSVTQIRKSKDQRIGDYEELCAASYTHGVSGAISANVKSDGKVKQSLWNDTSLYDPYLMFTSFLLKLESDLAKACLLNERWGLRNRSSEIGTWVDRVKRCRSIHRLAHLLVQLVDAAHPRAFVESWTMPIKANLATFSSTSISNEEAKDIHRKLDVSLSSLQAESERRHWERSSSRDLKHLLSKESNSIEDWVRDFQPELHLSNTQRRKRKNTPEICTAIDEPQSVNQTTPSTNVNGAVVEAVLGDETGQQEPMEREIPNDSNWELRTAIVPKLRSRKPDHSSNELDTSSSRGRIKKRKLESLLNESDPMVGKQMHWPIAGRFFFDPMGYMSPVDAKRLARRGGQTVAPFTTYSDLYEVGQPCYYHIFRKRVLRCDSHDELLLQIRCLVSHLDLPSIRKCSNLAARKVKGQQSETVVMTQKDLRTGLEYHLVKDRRGLRWISSLEIDLQLLVVEKSRRRATNMQHQSSVLYSTGRNATAVNAVRPISKCFVRTDADLSPEVMHANSSTAYTTPTQISTPVALREVTKRISAIVEAYGRELLNVLECVQPNPIPTDVLNFLRQERRKVIGQLLEENGISSMDADIISVLKRREDMTFKAENKPLHSQSLASAPATESNFNRNFGGVAPDIYHRNHDTLVQSSTNISSVHFDPSVIRGNSAHPSIYPSNQLNNPFAMPQTALNTSNTGQEQTVFQHLPNIQARSSSEAQPTMLTHNSTSQRSSVNSGKLASDNIQSIQNHNFSRVGASLPGYPSMNGSQAAMNFAKHQVSRFSGQPQVPHQVHATYNTGDAALPNRFSLQNTNVQGFPGQQLPLDGVMQDMRSSATDIGAAARANRLQQHFPLDTLWPAGNANISASYSQEQFQVQSQLQTSVHAPGISDSFLTEPSWNRRYPSSLVSMANQHQPQTSVPNFAPVSTTSCSFYDGPIEPLPLPFTRQDHQPATNIPFDPVNDSFVAHQYAKHSDHFDTAYTSQKNQASLNYPQHRTMMDNGMHTVQDTHATTNSSQHQASNTISSNHADYATNVQLLSLFQGTQTAGPYSQRQDHQFPSANQQYWG